MIRICRYCGDQIPEDAHLNRWYCCDALCYDSAKSSREREKRKSEAEVRKLKKETESKLKKLWLRFGDGKPFNPMNADEMGIDFSVADGIVKIDKHRATIVLEYAYIVVNTEKMMIWKLSNKE